MFLHETYSGQVLLPRNHENCFSQQYAKHAWRNKVMRKKNKVVDFLEKESEYCNRIFGIGLVSNFRF